MSFTVILDYLMAEAPVIVAVFVATWFLSRRDTTRQLNDASLAGSIDRLTSKLDEVVDALDHMDERIDKHEVEIAVLKQQAQ